MVRGFLLKLDAVNAAARADITRALEKVLPPPLLCRFLKSSPFQHDTWTYVDAQGEVFREQYWREVYPDWMRKGSPDLNELIDRLLDARRPRAAFFAVLFALDEIETSRLLRLLQEIGTCDVEESGTYQLDSHYLSEALNLLQKRTGVGEEEMARLEFLFVTVREHTAHRIPNLEKQVGKSPAMFVQALALIYRRNDGGEDPPEWKPKHPDKISALGTAAYRLLSNVRRVPGTDDTGKIDEDKLRTWVKEAQSLCRKHGRAELGDQKIGELLSSPNILGADGVWPCEQVPNVLEECGTPDMAKGVRIGIYNSRGAARAAARNGLQRKGIKTGPGSWRSNTRTRPA